jgi:phosphate transport system protein
MSQYLARELNQLKKKLLALCALVEETVQKAVKAVNQKTKAQGEEILEIDNQIDALEVEIEEYCLKILALYQPFAFDLRFVVAVLKMNNDLERIGDLAVNIAEQAIFLSTVPPIPFSQRFSKRAETMAEHTQEMLRKALDALIQKDLELAREVRLSDDTVDSLHREMYGEVQDYIKEHPDYAEIVLHYLSVSRYLERIADYATNIAEDVIYLIKGHIVRHHFHDL